MHLVLGLDLGTSFIKVTVFDADKGTVVARASNSDKEAVIISKKPGWAEQDPEQWWKDVKDAVKTAHDQKLYNPKEIVAIGISYQMHGLVVVDKNQKLLRDSIIWCDSRAVKTGEQAFESIGKKKCLNNLLNSPGNFTASKLYWVKQNEPEIFEKIDKIMLPGDFISMRMTGAITTTRSALSEGIFWDFQKGELSADVMDHFGFDKDIIPEVKEVFTEHGYLLKEVADELSLTEGIPITYKVGDQLNNALSLNVMKPGEIAATAGTSGVIYAITNELFADKYSRVNSFAHVNHREDETRIGVLLCINGCGIMNNWMRSMTGNGISYLHMDKEASQIEAGSEGLKILPFGNGAERMLRNKIPGARIIDLDLNKHHQAHLYRAVQEGVAFSFRYGVDLLRENGMDPKLVRAGRANMFLSKVFLEAFVNTTELGVELYDNDGSEGAAIGAAIGVRLYNSTEEAFKNRKPIKKVEVIPALYAVYENRYHQWKRELEARM